MEWRKAWEKNWDSIRYCSDSCRRDKFDKKSTNVRETILAMTKTAGKSKPVPATDVAQSLWPLEWETRLEEVRRVARLLHHEKLITILQNGKPITDLNFKGPVHFTIL
jgi:hypothetical protein